MYVSSKRRLPRFLFNDLPLIFPFFLTFIPAHDIIEEQIRQVIRPSFVGFGCYALQRWQPFLFVRYSSWVMRTSQPRSQQ